jgi:hypothetical protein
MDGFKALENVSCSLRDRGAKCKQVGINIIVATWKTTVWRILIDSAENNDPMADHHLVTARDKDQRAVFARTLTDGNIEYLDAENGKIIRPRCMVWADRNRILKREFHG